MGLLDLFKRKPRAGGLRYAPTMTGRTPTVSDFGDDIYASDLIVQAIRCKVTEFRKLKPRHVRSTGEGLETVADSDIAQILRRPNDWMTMGDFLEKCCILLELNKNCFIWPAYYETKGGGRYYTGLYPLKPNSVDYMADGSGRLFLRMAFGNGYRIDLPAADVIHWRKDYGTDDWFGGNLAGGGPDRGLLKLLREYDKLLQSIAVGLNASTKINGLLKANTYLNPDDQANALKDFNERLANNESGLALVDLKTEYVPLDRDVKLVDKDTMEFFYLAILRNTGVSLPIMNGDYTKSQKEAFYEHALEADIKGLGEAMSKVLFTKRQESFGHSVQLYPNSIVFMSMENKLSALQIGLPAGIFTKDEARELLGYPPMPNGQGKAVAQGYNALLDENNTNTLKQDPAPSAEPEGGTENGKEGQQGA